MPTRDPSGPKILPLRFGGTTDLVVIVNAPTALVEGMNATGTMTETMTSTATVTGTGTATAGGPALGPQPDVAGPPLLTGGVMIETATVIPIEMTVMVSIVNATVNATVTVRGPLLFPPRKPSRKITVLLVMIGTTTGTGMIRGKMAVLPLLMITEC